MNLPEGFLRRMKERLGDEFPAFFGSYSNPPVKGLRVNTLKISRDEFLKISPFPLEPVPWEENGFMLPEGAKAGADPYHQAGLYYCQEPSAMLPARLLGVKEGERVLDLCAAPGGKCTALAQALNETGILIANEFDYGRARILSENVERLGIQNCAVVSAEPALLAQRFKGYFQKILVDAPCSGEGMFKKEEAALRCWSEKNVRGCAARQKEILSRAAEMLCAGGRLVYSTCTFAPEENEEQIAEFVTKNPAFRLIEEHKLYPHRVRGEGQYAALLEKTDGETTKCKSFAIRQDKAAERAFSEFAKGFFVSPPELLIHTLENGRMYAVPPEMPALQVPTLRLGVELGTFDGKIFKPAHALATSLSGFKREVRLSREESLAYLGGAQLQTEYEGWCVVSVNGYPLGLGKAHNGVLKNYLPKSIKLRNIR